MNLIVWAVFGLIVLAGCQSLIPATTPPQLDHTPGTPLTITDHQIDTEWFSLDYPDGWRVVTNVAIAPIHLTLISPDDEIVIIVAETTGIDFSIPTPQAGVYTRWERLRHEGRDLSLSGEIDDAFATEFNQFFDSILESVTFP